jgi:peptidoglycan/xylan/chitin deacetylase (PgdA/CDA1 family)
MTNWRFFQTKPNAMKTTALKIKLLFITTVLLFATILATGIILLHDNYYFSQKYIGLQTEYLLRNTSLGGFTNALSLFIGKNDYVSKGNPAKGIPILVYHSLVEKPDGTNTTLKDFEDQMNVLKSAGYETVNITQLKNFIEGRKNLSNKSFLLTFDDGRSDSFYPADAIIRSLGYEAVMFAIGSRTQNQLNRYYLNLDELRYMQNTGRWDIESHSWESHDDELISSSGEKSHALSNLLWSDLEYRNETVEEYKTRISNDLTDSKNFFERELNKKVLGLAYPFGDYGIYSKNFPGSKDIILEKTRELYSLAFTQIWWGSSFTYNYPEAVGIHPVDLQTIIRINVNPDWNSEDLLSILENGAPKNLPYKDQFESDFGWIANWGKSEVSDGLLSISARGSTGAVAFLDGTLLWRNYEALGKVIWKSGDSIAVGARFQNDENFVMCHLIQSESAVRIEERIDGVKKTSVQVAGELPSVGSTFDFGIQVSGNSINCLVNGELIAKAAIDPSLSIGGVAWKVWDSSEEIAELLVDKMEVNEI